MTLKKTLNRTIEKKENDIVKAWCHNFTTDEKQNETYEYKNNNSLIQGLESKKEDPIFGNLIPVRDHSMDVHKGNVGNYNAIEIALQKVNHINPIDKPRMVFNVSKHIKQNSSQTDLTNFLDRSLDLDYITKSQKDEILKILE